MELFAEYTTLRSVIDCALEGRAGRVTVEGSGPACAARIDLGCYVVFGGEPDHPAVERWLARLEGPLEVLIPPASPWRDRLLRALADRTVDRTMATFDPETVDAGELARIAPVAGFDVRPLDARTAAGLDGKLEPHALQVFPDAQHFARHGFGFGAFSGDGRLAAQSSTYAISSERVEICISTDAEFRRRGLARRVGARMILECLRRELRPEWSAANPASQSLARSLGYGPSTPCEIRFLDAGEG